MVRDRWWHALGRVGLTEQRWKTWPAWKHRAAKAGFVGLLGVVVLAPIYGFDGAAYLAFAVVAVIYIPDWSRIRFGRYFLPAAVLALTLAYPYYYAKMPRLPIFTAVPSMTTAFTMAIFVMMALGLNIVVGYAGLLDLGYVAFYAIGAYTAGWIASPQAQRYNWNFNLGAIGVPPGLGGIHLSIWLVLPIAACLAALAGVIIGLPTLRLRGDYLAIVTLGFGEITYVVANNGDCLFQGFVGHCVNLTNGPQGINPIDPPGFGNWAHSTFGLPANFITAGNSLDLFYWAAIGLCLFVIYCSLTLRDSKLGRAWVAIREDETAAAAMGVPLMRTKTWAYAMGAFMGGIAGAFLKSEQTVAQPGDFLFSFSVFVL